MMELVGLLYLKKINLYSPGMMLMDYHSGGFVLQFPGWNDVFAI